MIMNLQNLIDALQEKAAKVDNPKVAQIGLIGYDRDANFQGVAEVDHAVFYDSGQKVEVIWLILEHFELKK